MHQEIQEMKNSMLKFSDHVATVTGWERQTGYGNNSLFCFFFFLFKSQAKNKIMSDFTD